MIWSIGATTDTDGRKRFDEYLRLEMRSFDTRVEFPDDGLVYDYSFDKERKSWLGWMKTIPEYQINPSLSYSEIIIPTIDSVRYTFLLELLLKRGKHVLCVGPTGTAKTVTVMEKLTKGMNPETTPIFINFSARTSQNQTQDILDGKFDKRR